MLALAPVQYDGYNGHLEGRAQLRGQGPQGEDDALFMCSVFSLVMFYGIKEYRIPSKTVN